MIYVFDTNIFIATGNYYQSRFPTFWSKLDKLVTNKSLLSTEQNFKEYNKDDEDFVKKWMNKNKHIFELPTSEETIFISDIYKVKAFKDHTNKKHFLENALHADPFVIAKARIMGGTVVTLEKEVPNSAKIPNICKHFKIPCINFEEFMNHQGWSF